MKPMAAAPRYVTTIFFVAFAVLALGAFPGWARSDIGVVVMPGKGGNERWVRPLVNQINNAGHRAVTSGNLPWSKGRIYDRTFEDALKEVDALVAWVKRRGAKRIIIGGHSLGAVVAAGYAARRGGLAGLLLLGPGHFVSQGGFAGNMRSSVLRAKAMIAEGKGGHQGVFSDINMGKRTQRRVIARTYDSWFDPRGPADFPTNMKNIKGGIPVLYVAGAFDRIPETKNSHYAFIRALANPKSKFVVVPGAKHLEIPRKGARTVVEWLNSLN